MNPLPPRGERALPLLAGLLLVLGCPPADFLVPPFIALVPLLVFIAERPAGPAGRWSATRAGFLTGVVYFGAQLYWFAVALIGESPLAVPAYLLTVLVLSGLVAAFAWGVHFTRDRLALTLPIAAALFWTALEWLQGNVGPLSFPWLGLGTSLAPYPRLAGAAELVGARGLTFWLALVNGTLALAVVRYRAARSARPALAAGAIVVALPAAFGFWRHATLELRPAARVVVVQPNIPDELKRDSRVALDTSLAALSRLTLEPIGGDVDLVAWPEVALPVDLAGSPALQDTVRALSNALDAPILTGAYGVDRDATRAVAFNSAFLVDDSGLADRRYDKQHLVPFVERVPFLEPDLPRGAGEGPPYYGGLERGGRAPILIARNGARLGVLICYESAFSGLARRYRRDGADFLVNLTNDAWFGGEPWIERTTALWQHPAHLTLRAIETRAGIARAANTGFSMFVDPLGRTYERTPLFRADVRADTVWTTDGTTLFVRWGDWVGVGAVVGVVVVVVVGWGGLGLGSGLGLGFRGTGTGTDTGTGTGTGCGNRYG